MQWGSPRRRGSRTTHRTVSRETRSFISGDNVPSLRVTPSFVGIVGGVLPPRDGRRRWGSRKRPRALHRSRLVVRLDTFLSTREIRIVHPAPGVRVARHARPPPLATASTPHSCDSLKAPVARWHAPVAPHRRVFHVKHRAHAASVRWARTTPVTQCRRAARTLSRRRGQERHETHTEREWRRFRPRGGRRVPGGRGRGAGCSPRRTPPGSRSDARPDFCIGSSVSRETSLEGRAPPVHCACSATLAFRGVSRSGTRTDRGGAAGSPTRLLLTHATVSAAPRRCISRIRPSGGGDASLAAPLASGQGPGSHALPRNGRTARVMFHVKHTITVSDPCISPHLQLAFLISGTAPTLHAGGSRIRLRDATGRQTLSSAERRRSRGGDGPLYCTA